MNRILRLLLPLALASALASCGVDQLGANREQRGPATVVVDPDSGPLVTVVSITDGDTLRVRFPDQPDKESTPVRIIGIDTPETRKPNTPVQCWGPEATKALTALAPPGARLRLVFDKDRTDRYDRTLAYLYARASGSADFAVDVGVAMVAQGAAKAVRYPPNTAMAKVLEDAQRIAMANHLGMWGVCP